MPGPLKLYYPKVLFLDRHDAGMKLASELRHHAKKQGIVMSIPRGGVAVASPVAKELGLPLDVLVVRKIPIPSNPEMGMGAITLDGTLLLDEHLVRELGLSQPVVEKVAESVKREIERRVKIYRGNKLYPQLADKTVILVDDGLATGFTMLAAIKSVKKQKASRLVVAVPVASLQAFNMISPEVDEFVTLAVQEYPSFAVASFYQEWSDMTDEEVLALLSK